MSEDQNKQKSFFGTATGGLGTFPSLHTVHRPNLNSLLKNYLIFSLIEIMFSGTMLTLDIGSTLGSATDTVGKGVSGVTDTLGNTVSGLGKGVGDTVSGVTRGVGDTTKSAGNFVSDTTKKGGETVGAKKAEQQ